MVLSRILYHNTKSYMEGIKMWKLHMIYRLIENEKDSKKNDKNDLKYQKIADSRAIKSGREKTND